MNTPTVDEPHTVVKAVFGWEDFCFAWSQASPVAVAVRRYKRSIGFADGLFDEWLIGARALIFSATAKGATTGLLVGLGVGGLAYRDADNQEIIYDGTGFHLKRIYEIQEDTDEEDDDNCPITRGTGQYDMRNDVVIPMQVINITKE